VRVVGIDLASAPAKTGVCVLEVGDGRARVAELRVGADDDALTALATGAARVGIDAPFGWPDAFRRLVAAPPEIPAPWTDAVRDAYRYRRSDRAVRAVTGRWPLSVSSDLLAVPAFRCRLLLARWGVAALDGSDRCVEVYPAAILAAWGFGSRGYKGRDGAARRAALLDGLLAAAPWLGLGAAEETAAAEADDAFDALLAALGALAVEAGAARPIPAEEAAAARREGWVMLPAGPIERLAGALALLR
jgi:hypothetical protein